MVGHGKSIQGIVCERLKVVQSISARRLQTYGGLIIVNNIAMSFWADGDWSFSCPLAWTMHDTTTLDTTLLASCIKCSYSLYDPIVLLNQCVPFLSRIIVSIDVTMSYYLFNGLNSRLH
jgi:hypothetical protein